MNTTLCKKIRETSNGFPSSSCRSRTAGPDACPLLAQALPSGIFYTQTSYSFDPLLPLLVMSLFFVVDAADLALLQDAVDGYVHRRIPRGPILARTLEH